MRMQDTSASCPLPAAQPTTTRLAVSLSVDRTGTLFDMHAPLVKGILYPSA
jgi:hypothetical protein